MQLKLLIDIQNHFMESLLGQYFSDLEFVADHSSDLIVQDFGDYLKFILRKTNQSCN